MGLTRLWMVKTEYKWLCYWKSWSDWLCKFSQKLFRRMAKGISKKAWNDKQPCCGTISDMGRACFGKGNEDKQHICQIGCPRGYKLQESKIELMPLIFYCKKLLLELRRYKIRPMFREANGVADLLAKRSGYNGRTKWLFTISTLGYFEYYLNKLNDLTKIRE